MSDHPGRALCICLVEIIVLSTCVWVPVAPALAADPPASRRATDQNDSAVLARHGARNTRAHDPSSIVRCGEEYWIFATGRGVASRRSKDLIHWENGPPVFAAPPPWVADVLPGHNGAYWAPDVIHVGDRYLLYY